MRAPMPRCCPAAHSSAMALPSPFRRAGRCAPLLSSRGVAAALLPQKPHWRRPGQHPLRGINAHICRHQMSRLCSRSRLQAGPPCSPTRRAVCHIPAHHGRCSEHEAARGCRSSRAFRAARQVSSSVSSSRRASSDLELDGSHLRPIRVTLSPVGAAVDRHADRMTKPCPHSGCA